MIISPPALRAIEPNRATAIENSRAAADMRIAGFQPAGNHPTMLSLRNVVSHHPAQEPQPVIPPVDYEVGRPDNTGARNTAQITQRCIQRNLQLVDCTMGRFNLSPAAGITLREAEPAPDYSGARIAGAP
ncbi:hypothetical protein [Stenotrophomonas sp. 22385]|uniref:hypothetical protein n=1 Tax=Stenotrophomonas sp. 22385 TaxID=3453915 RepID=UPI003F852737